MARQMSPEEYQELGKRYYKLKDYEKGINVLTQGIEVAPTLGLYDHRAATYEKLKDFNAAVKDGREMIKLDKKEVKGYLRTASVLEKMEKPEIALGIYKYGMKNVSIHDKNFKLLQQLHDKITRQLSPPIAMDPFTVLPVELAEMVLAYMPFRNMVNCMRVSKGWKDYLAKRPKLWLHLDLSGARKPVSRSFVGNAVRRSQNRLTRATICRFEHMDVLVNIAKACKELVELEFITFPYKMSSTLIDIVQCAPGLRKFIVHPVITTNTARHILRYGRSLEHVGFMGVDWTHYITLWQGPFEALHTLSIHMVKYGPGLSMGLDFLLPQTPNLQYLALSNLPGDVMMPWPDEISQLPPMETLVLKRVQFDRFPLLPPTLRRLEVDYDGSYRLGPYERNIMRSRVPKLTHLKLGGFELRAKTLESFLDSWTDEEYVMMQSPTMHPLTEATPLESLSVRGVLGTELAQYGLFKGRESLFGCSPRVLTPALLSLDISTLPCNDDEIEHLLTYKTGIQSIDISCTKITGASIKMLVDGLPSLKTIKAEDCPNIGGLDAIHYAERRGISVSWKMGKQIGKQRVNYG
ncbi:uncharacterized protein K460DRAFT_412993 [Cucurbitaria berberidis CBS 394.84]|uniref:F-box domain-containing protein n=1 Tax=Cucurbitaria berberidis CBS 394.84 TaxID=1168544 RepID=A0A9P4GTC5_9PLEO|nr:uncharacterized protein K460DRAFT_412993 [Cucurbitaria berberidis CBS 394.84]KAF1851432.1 hypothetical protein K460DRAFT_412993 [Cucurbitaria berberidis CBS 394.84]